MKGRDEVRPVVIFLMLAGLVLWGAGFCAGLALANEMVVTEFPYVTER